MPRSTPGPGTPRRPRRIRSAARSASSTARSRASREAGERGLGVRAWIEGRVGFAYGTDLSADGVDGDRRRRGRGGARLRLRRVRRRAGAARRARRRRTTATHVLRRPVAWTTDREGRPRQGGRALGARGRRARGRRRDHRLRRRGGALGAPLVDGPRRLVSRRASPTPTCRRSPRRAAPSRPASASGSGARRRRCDPEAIGREARRARGPALGRHQAGVAKLPRGPRPDRRGQLRRLHRRRPLRRRRSARALAVRAAAWARRSPPTPSPSPTTAPTRRAWLRRRSTPRACPRARTPLIEGGRLAAYLHDSYTARREGGGQGSTASAARAGYRSAPVGLDLEPRDRARRRRASSELLAEAGDGVYVTDVAGLHSGVNPVSGQFSVGASGVLIEGGELAAPATEFTIASDLVAMLSAVRAAGLGGPLGPVRRLGQDAAAADRRDGDRRQLAVENRRPSSLPQRIAALCGDGEVSRARGRIRSPPIRPSARSVRYPGWPHRRRSAPQIPT